MAAEPATARLADDRAWFAAVFPVKPVSLNLQANDICNARCRMCNIWTRRQGPEFSLAELRTQLGDPHLDQVAHVGITGGEPTLRGDLQAVYELLPEALPALREASFITNGFQSARIVALYAAVQRHYAERGLGFSGMVSVDGVGAVHDHVRGRPGVFAKTEATILGLRDQGVPVDACCTIVRSNVYGVEDLLAWGERHGIHVRFRIGNFIKRLYNADLTGEVLSFSRPETRHLVAFLHHLLIFSEKDRLLHNTYRSNVGMLVGLARRTRCPYQDGRALNLDSRLHFAHCGPQGQPHDGARGLGLALAAHAAERVQILSRHCAACIHDCHDELTAEAAGEAENDPGLELALYAPDDHPAAPAPAPAAPGVDASARRASTPRRSRPTPRWPMRAARLPSIRPRSVRGR